MTATYACDASAEYEYFRWEVSDIRTSSANCVQASEFSLIASVPFVEWNSTGKKLAFKYGQKPSADEMTTGGYACYSLNNGSGGHPSWAEALGEKGEAKTVVFDNSFRHYRPTTCLEWFATGYYLENLQGMEYLNTEKVTDMSQMFQACYKLTSIDLSWLNTANVTKMDQMFSGCSALTTIYVNKNFTTEKCEDKESKLFSGCTSLNGAAACDGTNNIGIGYANYTTGYLTLKTVPYARLADNVLTLYYDGNQSAGDYSSDPIGTGSDNLPGWHLVSGQVSKAVLDASFKEYIPTDCSNWFCDMTRLSAIENLDFLNTSKIEDMSGMFKNCSSLTVLDLADFNKPNDTNAEAMFSGCTSLTTVYASDKFTDESPLDISDMFLGCTALRGAISYDASKTHVGYANYTTGYFTKKVGANGADILGAAGEPLTIASLVIEDDKAFKLTEEKCQAANASYSRGMTSNWGTLCLPFSIDVAAEGNTCNFYSLESVNDDNVVLSRVEEGTVEAGKPVVVRKKDESQTSIDIMATNAIVVPNPENEVSGNRLMGTFAGEVLSSGGYFIAKDKFFSVGDFSDKGVKVNPFRAYIQTEEKADPTSVLNIVIGGNVTSINAVTTVNALNSPATEYFDASGRRANGLQKGLNVVRAGNKTIKVMVK